MNLLRTDVISVYDLRFKEIRQLPWPSLRDSDSRIASRLNESFGWNFYGGELQGFDSFDLSSVVPNCVGAALRVNRRAGVGSLLVWRTSKEGSDPLGFKIAQWQEGDHELSSLEQSFEELRGDRIYPFVSIQAEADVDQLDVFASSHAAELGRLLTSDLEGERVSALEKYIDSDLSLRAYEKLFLRWTDALAVYSRFESTDFYENCMFRAVQIFEHCILAEVSLISLVERMDRFSRKLMLVTLRRWFRAHELFVSLAETESVFFVYPRTQSVEANRLLAAAHDQFGLNRMLASAKSKDAEVRNQFEWAKTQTLGMIAVATYLVDKLVGWENIRHGLGTLFRH